jgi:Flp pilus assembly pilin Flp
MQKLFNKLTCNGFRASKVGKSGKQSLIQHFCLTFNFHRNSKMIKSLQFKSSKFSQKGQGMTEYIIIVALIAVAAIGVYSFFGQAIRGQMSGMTAEISGQKATAGQAAATAASGLASGEAVKKDMGTYGGSQGK